MHNGTGEPGQSQLSENDDDRYNLASFDAYDHASWFFGKFSRERASTILMREHDDGVFLVRDSKTCPGSYVLSVRESGRDSLISHYLIERKEDPEASPSESPKYVYAIGQQKFYTMPDLLEFYKMHYLESTPLLRPAPRQSMRVRAKFDFTGQEDTDLPFRKGEVLWVIQNEEDSQHAWWTAKNALGQTGQIPSSYVEIEPEPETESAGRHSNNSLSDRNSGASVSSAESSSGGGDRSSTSQTTLIQRPLPSMARVKQQRIPNAYDKTALRLKVGDLIRVTKMDPSGNWEGELNGRQGHFPFTYVEWVDDKNV